MSYTIQKVEMDQALAGISQYRYALVYRTDGIILGNTAEIGDIEWGECLEARFFDESRELHVYEEDGALCAVEVEKISDDDCLMKKYELRKHYFGENKCLCVCEHFDYDEDGQAFVALTRLTGIENTRG